MTTPEDPSAGLPRRELREATVLRALAHPVRLHLLEELGALDRATATELAERLGESPANCSWHLRQLAKHGFIEEAGGGAGRQRPWKLVAQSNIVTGEDEAEGGTELAAAHDELLNVVIDREVEALRGWQRARGGEPAEWVEAVFAAQSSAIWLTAEETAEIKRELHAVYERLVWPRLDRMEPDRRPAGSRRVRFVAWAIPNGPPHSGE
ncbi:helix-turn-helix domain-containing protein [Glycomyces sp. A-F 0318]|uniref:winged helix-turn-helix domain-containing protein n=1 Tax=Glycomyces amatae TaxID=2881355 RepID=UPI001E321D53|nr:helix-turn-helix domain-containing protein [Glycomyces amatae]MCD0445372.1 helix-turn-helix domain-containing protein [Glycomyces amatae]